MRDEWIETLENLFGAWVTQESLQDAAAHMAAHAEAAPRFRERVDKAFAIALAPENSADKRLIACVNESGYRVENVEDALWFVAELQALYEACRNQPG